MTFPNLNSIGFAARAGQKAIFTDYQLNNLQYGTGVLFGENVGATSAIWDGAEALLVKLVVTYADGTTQTIVSALDTWSSTSDGPLLCLSPCFAFPCFTPTR